MEVYVIEYYTGILNDCLNQTPIVSVSVLKTKQINCICMQQQQQHQQQPTTITAVIMPAFWVQCVRPSQSSTDHSFRARLRCLFSSPPLPSLSYLLQEPTHYQCSVFLAEIEPQLVLPILRRWATLTFLLSSFLPPPPFVSSPPPSSLLLSLSSLCVP